MNIVNEIKKYSEQDFNTSFKSISCLILELKDGIFDMTILDVADRANTSVATITRFCKVVGLKGFKEMTFLLRDAFSVKENEIVNEEEVYDLNLSDEENLKILYEKQLKISKAAFKNNKNELCKMLSCNFSDYKRIYLIAHRANTYLLIYIKSRLLDLKLECNIILDDWKMETQVELIEQKSLVVVFDEFMEKSVVQTINNKLSRGEWCCVLFTTNKHNGYLIKNNYVVEIKYNSGLVKNLNDISVNYFLNINYLINVMVLAMIKNGAKIDIKNNSISIDPFLHNNWGTEVVY